MAYTKVWPEGWKDNEEGGTYIDAAGLNKMEQGIIDAHDFMERKDNPHEVTKAQVGLGNVPNVTTNDQTPTYTAAGTLSALTSGEKISAAMGKLSKAVSTLIADDTKLSGIESGAQKNTITGVKGNAESSYRTGNVNITPANVGLGNVNNTSDANKPISTATQAALDGKQDTLTFDETPTENSENPVKSGGVAALTNPLYEEKTAGPSDVVTIGDGIANAPLQSCVVDIEPVQDLHGYDHPWPGGGGKNLLNFMNSKTTQGITFTYDPDTGKTTFTGTSTGSNTVQDLPSSGHTTKYPLLAPGSYIISTTPLNSSKAILEFRLIDTELNPVSEEIAVPSTGYNLVIDEPRYIMPRYAVKGTGVTVNETAYAMIRLASDTDPTFEPYANICPITGWDGAKVTRTDGDGGNVSTYTTPFPETVYGGTLDVATGVLVVDKGHMVISGSASLTKDSESTGSITRFYFRCEDMLRRYDYRGKICASYMTTARNSTFLGTNKWEISGYYVSSGSNPNRNWLYLAFNENITDAKQATAYLSENPLTIIYPLATPLTYHLTPQQIRLLAGTNNISADAGPVTVTYRGDLPNLYRLHNMLGLSVVNGKLCQSYHTYEEE